jgi:hypothetical protein
MQGETPLEKDPRIKSEDDEGGQGIHGTKLA